VFCSSFIPLLEPSPKGISSEKYVEPSVSSPSHEVKGHVPRSNVAPSEKSTISIKMFNDSADQVCTDIKVREIPIKSIHMTLASNK